VSWFLEDFSLDMWALYDVFEDGSVFLLAVLQCLFRLIAHSYFAAFLLVCLSMFVSQASCSATAEGYWRYHCSSGCFCLASDYRQFYDEGGSLS